MSMLPKKFSLICETRDDGGLRVRCDEIPGLILSAADPHAVLRDIAEAVRMLTTHNAARHKQEDYIPWPGTGIKEVANARPKQDDVE